MIWTRADQDERQQRQQQRADNCHSQPTSTAARLVFNIHGCECGHKKCAIQGSADIHTRISKPALIKVGINLQTPNALDNIRGIKVSHATKEFVTDLVSQCLVTVAQIRSLIVTPKACPIAKQSVSVSQASYIETCPLRGPGNLIYRVVMLLSKAREQLQRQLHHVALNRRPLFDALKHGGKASNVPSSAEPILSNHCFVIGPTRLFTFSFAAAGPFSSGTFHCQPPEDVSFRHLRWIARDLIVFIVLAERPRSATAAGNARSAATVRTRCVMPFNRHRHIPCSRTLP